MNLLPGNLCSSWWEEADGAGCRLAARLLQDYLQEVVEFSVLLNVQTPVSSSIKYSSILYNYVQ